MRDLLIRQWRRGLMASVVAALTASGGSTAARRTDAQPTAAELLRRSTEAGAARDYSGTKRLVFYGGDRPREVTLRVIHLRPNRTRTEFYSPERMRGAVRMEIGKDAWRFHPESGQWRRSMSRDPDAIDLTRLLANYTVTKERTDRVAARRCCVVGIKPKRAGNPSRRVWIDAYTSLPLKTQFFGADGELISEATFADIRFDVPKSTGGLIRPPKVTTGPDEKRPTLSFEPVEPFYLPAGYEAVPSTALSVRGRASSHLRYSDGLGTISLFEERREKESDERERSHDREQSHHRRDRREFPSVLRWEYGDMRFTLIGDVSTKELRKIAASLPGGQNAQPPSASGRHQ